MPNWMIASARIAAREQIRDAERFAAGSNHCTPNTELNAANAPFVRNNDMFWSTAMARAPIMTSTTR
jgi:hypothetical protein